MSARADFRASNYRMEFGGTSYQLDARGKSYLVRVPLIGRFNVANSMAALAAANALGINLRDAVLSLGQIAAGAGPLGDRSGQTPVSGLCRLRAHADALLNVLKTLRELEPRRLIVVFGCGGDRDRQKRPLMAGSSIKTPITRSSLPIIRAKKIPTRLSPRSKKDFAPIITKKSPIARRRSPARLHSPNRATSSSSRAKATRLIRNSPITPSRSTISRSRVAPGESAVEF